VGCSTCRNLEQALARRNSECTDARASTYSHFSSRFVAYNVVEMERAKSELQVHRSSCVNVESAASRKMGASRH
jgi:hypothetical protein